MCSHSLTASLMMHGRNNGKKIKAVEIVRNSCEIIHLLTDSNPIQVIVDAVINRWAAPLRPLLRMTLAPTLCASLQLAPT